MEPTHAWTALLEGRARIVRRDVIDRRWFAILTLTNGPGLSPRQREILSRLAAGQSSAEIGYDLGVADSTVASHEREALTRIQLCRLDLPIWAKAAYHVLRGSPNGPCPTWTVASPTITRESFPELSPAERDVASLALAGHDNRAIARARASSERTVANQLVQIYRKLGTPSRLDLASLVATRCALSGLPVGGPSASGLPEIPRPELTSRPGNRVGPPLRRAAGAFA